MSSVSSLYILDINLLLDTLFANIFFHSVGYLFCFVLLIFHGNFRKRIKSLILPSDYVLFTCMIFHIWVLLFYMYSILS